MLKQKRNLVLDIYDHAGNKQCSLYDQTSDASGQATNVIVTTERNGWKELSFTLPQNIHTEDGDIPNFRNAFVKEGYRIRLIDDDGVDWFILSESKISHNNYTKTLTITAGHVSQLLKYKRLDLEFSDEEGNNVGTAYGLLETILEDTGWTPGYVHEFKEKNGDIKYRSMKASSKTGAFKLIANMCDLFEAKPIYHGADKTVDIVPLNPFTDPKNGKRPDVDPNTVVELHYGVNVKNVTRSLDEENMITKLYAYGSYGEKDTGYCGIDECTHHLYTLIVGTAPDIGTECMINLTDAYGNNVVGYFIMGDAELEDSSKTIQKTRTIQWSDLDPCSRMYVWDPTNECAYLLYETPRINDGIAMFTEDEDKRKEETNWFSFIMDFNYYNDCGLLTNRMLQKIANYQMKAPQYMTTVSDKATTFAEDLTELRMTVGTTDFCKLDCEILKPADGQIQLRLNKTIEHPDGVIYRTDYAKKEDKYFKWRVATALKGNGDPVVTGCSLIYIIYEQKGDIPFMYDTSYIKEIDDTEDPEFLTLWLTSTNTRYEGQDYRVYLVSKQNFDGRFGAIDSINEAGKGALKAASTRIIEHATYYERTQPSITTNILASYGWWWKWYDSGDPSELYFCWGVRGDTTWKRVLTQDVDPAQQEGDYWYNWRKALLWRKVSGAWVAINNGTDNEDMSSRFGAIINAYRKMDCARVGTYQTYTYNETTNHPDGNYALYHNYDYFLFKTTRAMAPGDVLTYDTTEDTVTLTANVETETFQVTTYPADAVKHMPANILTDTFAETKGELDIGDGSEKASDTKYMSNFVAVCPKVKYKYEGYNGDLTVLYYDENRRYLGYATVFGHGGIAETPGYIQKETAAGLVNTSSARFIRIMSDQEIDPKDVKIASVNYENEIIVRDKEIFTVLKDLTGSGELKGYIPLIRKFAEYADKAYGDSYADLRNAQAIVKGLESEMIAELGDLYREGYWQKNDYVDGDEQKLYDDALDNLTKLSKPEAKYDIGYLDLYGSNEENFDDAVTDDIPKIVWPDISTSSAVHLVDPDANINCWAFVDKIQKCYDQPWKTKISINTNLTTISQHSFTDVMSHIADVSKETKGKMSVYERAAAITDNGYLTAERLEGTIDANRVQLMGASSTWYTDDKGNMIFESGDGTSAMMLTGNGFGLANSKDEWGDWNWRSFGNGQGFSADELITGFLSAERIQAGTITVSHLDAGVGGELDISANKSLKIAVSDAISSAEIEITPGKILEKLEETQEYQQLVNDVSEISDLVGTYRLQIESTSDFISNSIQATRLTAHVYKGNKDVTSEFNESRFNWKRTMDDNDETWNSQHVGMKYIDINKDEINYGAVYSCELTEE